MAVVLKQMYETYSYINDLSDPRSKDDWTMNPFVILTICVVYYKFIKDWGPKFMENRQPFKIKKVIAVYNIIQIVCCAFVFSRSLTEVYWKGYYSLKCQPLNWDETPMELLIVKYVKYYYYLKVLDLLDTVFFVLRKKSNHISFLHYYHHILMAISSYLAARFFPGGHATIVGTLNCFVHSVMYTYYLLTIINPEYKKSIWWKKHLTQLQILQFVIFKIHFTHPLFQTNCGYPKSLLIAFLPQNTFMIMMFADFYYKTYIKKKQ